MQSSDVFEARSHTIFFCWREQFMFEGLDAGVEAFGVEVEQEILTYHPFINSDSKLM